ncbi:bifunctional serine/threonine-protein kinase/formylglycine-generating enzyme family protein [Planctomycetaceae bacterium SH139]
MRERTIFLRAIDIEEPSARAQFLEQTCNGDDMLRKRVEGLLEATSRLGSFLDCGSSSNWLNTTNADSELDAEPATAAAQQATTLHEPVHIDLSFLEPSFRPGVLGSLAHYEVESVIGQGAFGIVLKARDTKLGRDVAIKVLQPHLATTSPPRKRFVREARACASIRHPNVISVYAVEESPLPYLVMEYVRGSTLQDLINLAGPLELEEILPLAAQLSSALSAAHENGLIHRDVKPSNILIEAGAERRLVITDFGLARTVDDTSLTQSGLVAGTPMYMSPEQASGRPVDARADLFSLGSVLYVMVTGRPPFRASTSLAIMHRVVSAIPRAVQELIPDAPDWLCSVIEKLQAKRPNERFQSAREVSQLLQQFQTDLQRFGSVQSATLSGLGGENAIVDAPCPTSRKPLTTILGVGLALALAAAFPLGLMLRQETTHPQADGNSSAAVSTSKGSGNGQAQEEAGPNTSNGIEVKDGAPPPLRVPVDSAKAASIQQAWADYLGVPVEFENRWAMKFRLIPPGEFLMGSTNEDVERTIDNAHVGNMWRANIRSEVPQHSVKLSKPFYMATTEVTQRQYEHIMSANPSLYSGGQAPPNLSRSASDLPVEKVSWLMSKEFLTRLSIRDGILQQRPPEDANYGPGGYRFPTEAEWEFACRGGNQSRFWCGDDYPKLRLVENVGGGKVGLPETVASRSPNPFGLYDMHGNVREWIADRWSDDYYNSLVDSHATDPQGPTSFALTFRVVRGGDFWWHADTARSSSRCAEAENIVPDVAIGIRPVLDLADYPFHARAKAKEPKVVEFAEIHGASFQELRNWIDSLDRRFVPTVVNVRTGTETSHFDAVALEYDKPKKWIVQFHTTEEFDADFDSLRRSHACIWRVAFPLSSVEQASQDTIESKEDLLSLSVWIERKPDHFWAVWTTPSSNLETSFNVESGSGWIPRSITELGEYARYAHEFMLGVGHRIRLRRPMRELADLIEQSRTEQWQPFLLQTKFNPSQPEFFAVLRDDVDGQPWEFSNRISEEEYSEEITLRRLGAWYPAHTLSYVEDQKVFYSVVWRAMHEPSELP